MRLENEIFWLSSTTYNAIDASAICLSIGGEFPQFDEGNVKDVLFPIFEDLYLKGIEQQNVIVLLQ